MQNRPVNFPRCYFFPLNNINGDVNVFAGVWDIFSRLHFYRRVYENMHLKKNRKIRPPIRADSRRI